LKSVIIKTYVVLQIIAIEDKDEDEDAEPRGSPAPAPWAIASGVKADD